jgi:hypothetical protein
VLLPLRAHARPDTATIATKCAVQVIASQTGREHAVWETSRGLRRWRWYAVEFALDAAGDDEREHPPVMGAEAEGHALTRTGAERAARAAFHPFLAKLEATRGATIARMTRSRALLVHALDRASVTAFTVAAAAALGTIACLVTAHGVALLGFLLLCAGSLAVGFRLEEWAEALVEATERALGDR